MKCLNQRMEKLESREKIEFGEKIKSGDVLYSAPRKYELSINTTYNTADRSDDSVTHSSPIFSNRAGNYSSQEHRYGADYRDYDYRVDNYRYDDYGSDDYEYNFIGSDYKGIGYNGKNFTVISYKSRDHRTMEFQEDRSLMVVILETSSQTCQNILQHKQSQVHHIQQACCY